MAAHTDTTTTHDVTTDAAFRAWGLAIRTAIENAGLVRTSDTGQIDFTSVTAPAINTMAGYDIFRFDDAEQASDPIFIKLRYGKGGNTVRPALEYQVGTGSDGAGTLVNGSTAVSAATSGTPTGTGVIHASFFDGAFGLISFGLTSGSSTNVNNNMTGFVVERVRDADTNDLVPGHIQGFNVSNFPSGKTRKGGAWEVLAPNIVTGSLKANNKMRPGYFMSASYPAAPMRSLLLAKDGEVSAGDSGDITVAGITRTYKRIDVVSTAQTIGLNLPVASNWLVANA